MGMSFVPKHLLSKTAISNWSNVKSGLVVWVREDGSTAVGSGNVLSDRNRKKLSETEAREEPRDSIFIARCETEKPFKFIRA